ncbi:MAG: DUF4276 family protein [Acidobacteria bacterium]|nr:DUF4276 family protein [Acidobacteriota bacterium]MYJ02984.1 DUF4276 family protein [Acidobacteriota bacterium]
MYLRLNFIVEGQTEERFVNTVLREHFADRSIVAVAHCVTTRRERRAEDRRYRGGLTTYQHARDDIRRWVRGDGGRDARFTTMFDLYKLPADFPGYAEAAKVSDPYARVGLLEAALSETIGDRRFIPYIQLHEFEALLFADPQKLDTQFPDRPSAIEQLVKTAREVDSPELVDDGPTTAPSKRISAAIPEYDRRKASAGPIVAAKIGLPVLQTQCRHFREWLERLTSVKVDSRL